MVNAFIYILIFLALFFEVFLLLTFCDVEAVRRRRQPAAGTFPSVSVIVPCYNEEKTVQKTVASLLTLSYPTEKLSIILVNDGSKDRTRDVVETYRTHPQISVIHKTNGGKYSALNAGIAANKSEFIAFLDADSFVEPNALKESMAHFDAENIGAVTASMSVFEPKTVLERMQQAEYLFGIILRHIMAAINGLYVTPGPFSIFRKRVFDELGMLRHAHNTEDMEIALRMQRAGMRIQNAPRARVYTTVPKTLSSLLKQRVRWTSGFLRNGIEYRDLFFNARYEVLGLLVLPLGVVSLFSRVGMFTISVGQFFQNLFSWIRHATEVPFLSLFHTPSFDWFFAPLSAIMVLSVVTLLLFFSLMFLGAQVSGTKTKLGLAIPWYFLLYGFISTIWIVRSLTDVALGIRRSWR